MKTEDSEMSLDETTKPLPSTETQPQSLSTTVLNVPLRLGSYAISTSWRYFRPLAPQVVPIVVFFSFVPIVSFLSFSAGWLVWTMVAVGWQAPVFLQYGDNRAPYSEVVLSSLSSKQAYDISLVLNVPPTEPNLSLGNFMTSLVLTSSSNATLAQTRVPSLVLQPRSSWLFGSSSTFTLQVPLLKSFTFGTSKAIAYIDVGRRDGWTSLGSGHGRELTVASATLQGTLVHQGVRGLITRFPLLFSAFAAFGFFVITMGVLAAFVIPLEDIIASAEPEESSEEDEEDRRRRLRRLSRGSRSASREWKPAGQSAIIPPA
ncbi:hypothetical protein DL96DRAFT_1575951 [Flagelloscypha sp. PMI_526]|nr:hypothetical protein DL96DRAFT_1575951 [Flagelloscypha sp. PMI_526]